jgi:hypothetical protein
VVSLAVVLRPRKPEQVEHKAIKPDAIRAVVPTAPAPIPKSSLITVGTTGEAGARTLAEALARIKPGGTIRVLDDATYPEAIVLDDATRWRGLTIESPRRATLHAPDPGPALAIRDTPGVTVRGFRFRTSEARGGITVEGTTTGLVLEDLEGVQAPRSRSPAIHLSAESDTTGTPAVTLRRSRIEGAPPTVCVWVQAKSANQSAGGVRIEANDFRGPTVHLLFWGPVHDVTVTGNRFEGGKNGINLNFKTPGEAHRVLIANNTFRDTEFWLGLVFTDPREQEVTVANNLILGGRKVETSRAEQTGEVADHWSFLANWWEAVPASDDPLAVERGLVLARTDVALRSRDPKSPEYLRPADGSPLTTAGAGGDLPRYVGAFPPADPKPR